MKRRTRSTRCRSTCTPRRGSSRPGIACASKSRQLQLFPRFDRNLNTGGRNYDETTWRVAKNAIHHSAAHPSRLVLPVVRYALADGSGRSREASGRPSTTLAGGTWLIACSASAVMLSDGLTPGLAGIVDAVADQQVLVAEGAVARVDHAASRVGADGARRRGCARWSGCWRPPRGRSMCAIAAGVLARATRPLAFATAMKVGLGFVRVLLRAQPEPPKQAGAAARKAIALSLVCITSTTSERRLQPDGPEPAQRTQRMPEDARQQHERPREARAVAGERREQQRHEVARRWP